MTFVIMWIPGIKRWQLNAWSGVDYTVQNKDDIGLLSQELSWMGSSSKLLQHFMML